MLIKMMLSNDNKSLILLNVFKLFNELVFAFWLSRVLIKKSFTNDFEFILGYYPYLMMSIKLLQCQFVMTTNFSYLSFASILQLIAVVCIILPVLVNNIMYTRTYKYNILICFCLFIMVNEIINVFKYNTNVYKVNYVSYREKLMYLSNSSTLNINEYILCVMLI